MKVRLELNFVDDRVYLNYWDFMHGRDVNCQIEDGKLMKFVHSLEEHEELELQHADYDPFEKEEITIDEFVELVRKRSNTKKNDRT